MRFFKFNPRQAWLFCKNYTIYIFFVNHSLCNLQENKVTERNIAVCLLLRLCTQEYTVNRIYTIEVGLYKNICALYSVKLIQTLTCSTPQRTVILSYLNKQTRQCIQYRLYTFNQQKYWLLVILKIYFLIAKLCLLCERKMLLFIRHPKFSQE